MLLIADLDMKPGAGLGAPVMHCSAYVIGLSCREVRTHVPYRNRAGMAFQARGRCSITAADARFSERDPGDRQNDARRWTRASVLPARLESHREVGRLLRCAARRAPTGPGNS